MAAPPPVGPGLRTAVLVIDAQNDYIHPGGERPRRLGLDTSECLAALGPLNDLVDGARRAGAPVFYIRNVHAPVNTLPNKWRRRGEGARDLWPTDGTWGAQLHEDLTPPVDGDVLITKHNYDAFQDTPLRLHLDAMGVGTLVLGGFSTEVCIESTARRAFVEGFDVIVAEDATRGGNRAAWEASLRVTAGYFGAVSSSQEILREQGWTR